MSTTIVETWAVNMADLGPIYPFVGSEMFLFIIGLVLWIGFHITQMKAENAHYEKECARLRDKETMKKALCSDDGA